MKACALLVACLAAGCGSKVEGAITYAEVSSPGGEHALTLDVRVPEGEGPFPAILFIHGGGWVIGDLSVYHDAIATVAARGYVGVTINYRLADEGDDDRARWPWPAQIQDVSCALHWLATNATEYKVDISRVATIGESAGGHLAMMAAFARDEPRFQPVDCPHQQDVDVKAVVSIFGVSDPAAVFDTTEWWVRRFMARWLNLPDGARPADHPEAFADVAPLTFMTPENVVPAHIIQGTKDTVVPPVTQRSFVAAARAVGQDVSIEYLEGVGHDPGKVNHAVDLGLDWLRDKL